LKTWWKSKITFSVGKRTIKIFFKGNKENSKLYISSSPAKSYRSFLEEVRKTHHISQNDKNYKKAFSLGLELDKPKSKSMTQAEANKIVANLNEFASIIENLVSTPQNPPSIINFGNVNSLGGATLMTAKVLSKNHKRGSKPQDNPPISIT